MRKEDNGGRLIGNNGRAILRIGVLNKYQDLFKENKNMSWHTNLKRKWTVLVLVSLATLLISLTGCATKKETGALTGAGVGALAGQIIGGNTAGTLIGAGVGAGVGYLIGNDMDKKEAQEMSQKTAAQNYQHKEDTWPLAGTKWKIDSISPPDVTPPYTSKLVEFQPNGHVVTTTTKPDGKVDIAQENYRVVGDTLIVNKPGYIINAKFSIDGKKMSVHADKFSAVLTRIQ